MSSFVEKAASCPYMRQAAIECPWMHKQVTSCPHLAQAYEKGTLKISTSESSPEAETVPPGPITKEVSSSGLLVPSIPSSSNDQ